VLGEQSEIPSFSIEGSTDPLKICRKSVDHARKSGRDVVILDTAGRLHIDKELVAELQNIRDAVKPSEILLVADAMTGQDAVNAAENFHTQVGVTGVVLTKLDGDARGGAAISVRAVTGQPIKFVGVGEKLDALEAFHPDRIASRILGMGDVLSLVEKAQENIDEEHAAKLQEKLLKAQFTLEDFQEQLQQLKKMGPLDELMGMIPGMSKFKGMQPQEKDLVKVEAVINSMTKKERLTPKLLNASRKKRVAAGSGSSVQEINKLLKMHRQMADMMKKMGGGKGKRGMLGGLGGLMGGGMPGGMPPGMGGGGLPPGMGAGGMPDLSGIDQKQLEKMAKQMGGPGGMPKLPGLGGPGLGGGKKK
jgi:signal recognition particle subunit SRP54